MTTKVKVTFWDYVRAARLTARQRADRSREGRLSIALGAIAARYYLEEDLRRLGNDLRFLRPRFEAAYPSRWARFWFWVLT
jgi:hypothetical protein